MIAWLIKNVEWIFSGIGVFIVTVILAVFFKKNNGVKMYQEGGDGSINIQSGKDTNIK